MPLTAVNGTNIHYQFDGPVTGPVIMLSNSLASDMTMWDSQMEPLMQAGYRVLRYDSRGHGQSSAPSGPYTMEMLAADAMGLIDHLGLEHIHFCGLSMGGMVGQILGARHGSRLRSLMLCDTSSWMPQREMWEERIDMVTSGGMQPVADGAIDRWFTKGGQERLPEAIRKARHMILQTSPAGYCGCCVALRDMDLRPLHAAITPPTLILVGDQDQSTPVSEAEFIRSRIASAQLTVIPDAAHLSNVEQADIFNAALIEFIISIDH